MVTRQARTVLEQHLQDKRIPYRHVAAALEMRFGVTVPLASISRWVTGKGKPRWDSALKLADLFDTPPNELFSEPKVTSS